MKNLAVEQLGLQKDDLEDCWTLQHERFKLKYHGIMVAASGGLDSTVLFHLICDFFKTKKNFPVALFHMNYGLRKDDSLADQRFLENLAERLGVPIFVETVDANEAKQLAEKNTQARARALRHSHFARFAKEGWLMALGHHQDDLAENTLLRLARGVGPGSLGGMSEYHAPFWRPLLAYSKKDLAAWATGHKMPFREDLTNATMVYSRNVIRNKVIPDLDALFPGAAKRIGRCALEVQELTAFVRRTFYGEILAARSESGLDLAALNGLEPSVIREVLSSTIGTRKTAGYLTHSLLNSLLRLIATGTDGAFHLPGGGTITIKKGRLYLKDDRTSSRKI